MSEPTAPVSIMPLPVPGEATVNMANEIFNGEMFSREQLASILSAGFGGQRDYNKSFGHPTTITAQQYWELYKRGDLAHTLITCYPDECWAVTPLVRDDDTPSRDPNREPSEFEQAVEDLEDEYKSLWTDCLEGDRLAGIDRYGILILGFDDGLPLDQEVKQKKGMKIQYIRPLSNRCVTVATWETDKTSLRFGLPLTYTINTSQATTTTSSMEIEPDLMAGSMSVHWTRVVHIMEGNEESRVFGTPRLEPIINRLLDCHKVLGASAEMFWLGAFGGINFKLDKDVNLTETQLLALKEQVKNYINGMQRFLTTRGVDAQSLGSTPQSPEGVILAQLKFISAFYRIPLRILFGAEQGVMAGDQNERSWEKQVKRRRERFVGPIIVEQVIQRCIDAGVLPEPKDGQFWVEWGEEGQGNPLEMADVATKKTAAMAQYVTSGLETLITFKDYLERFLGFEPWEAQLLVDNGKAAAEEVMLEEQKQAEADTKAMADAQAQLLKDQGQLPPDLGAPQIPPKPGIPGIKPKGEAGFPPPKGKTPANAVKTNAYVEHGGPGSGPQPGGGKLSEDEEKHYADLVSRYNKLDPSVSADEIRSLEERKYAADRTPEQRAKSKLFEMEQIKEELSDRMKALDKLKDSAQRLPIRWIREKHAKIMADVSKLHDRFKKVEKEARELVPEKPKANSFLGQILNAIGRTLTRNPFPVDSREVLNRDWEADEADDIENVGGPGSGNHGHSGRPGEVGGSGDSFHGVDMKDVITREVIGTKTVDVKGKDEKGNPTVTQEQRNVYRFMQNGREVTDKAQLDRVNKLARVQSDTYFNVHIASDPNAKLQAVVEARNGKIQYVYSADFEKGTSAEKFQRVAEFTREYGSIKDKINDDATAGKPEAIMAQIMDRTTMRVGGKGEYENLGDHVSYGLTTLEDRHVSVSEDKVRFQFVGKAGVEWDRTIEDPQIAKFVLDRKGQAPSPDSPLFHDVRADKFNAYVKSVSGDKYTAKDFRTLHATRIATEVVQPHVGKTLSSKERNSIMKEASVKASELLGNTPGEAKAKYIDPTVWGMLGTVKEPSSSDTGKAAQIMDTHRK